MKIAFVLVFLLFFGNSANHIPANPNYDFPEAIVARNGKGFAYYNNDMNDLCISGYYKEARLYEDSFVEAPKPIYTTIRNKIMVDANAFILRQAAKYRVIMINESHARPQHRLFTKALLKGLYDQGYRVFMAEGISFVNNLEYDTYPIRSDGHLLNEPVYASLIRYARKLGYKVSAYEQYIVPGEKLWDDSIKLDAFGSIKYISHLRRDSITLLYDEHGLKMTIMTSIRERDQAEHILDIIRQNPGAKFIVHVGEGHLYQDGSMMGAKLKKLLDNENLLAIDQVTLDERRSIIDSLTGSKIENSTPFLLLDTLKNTFFHFFNDAHVNYTLFNAEINDSLSRPSYLFKDPEKRTVYRLPPGKFNDCPCVFAAYYTNEYDKEKENAIAVDVIYYNKDAESPPLLLYKGTYRIIKENEHRDFTGFDLQIK